MGSASSKTSGSVVKSSVDYLAAIKQLLDGVPCRAVKEEGAGWTLWSTDNIASGEVFLQEAPLLSYASWEVEDRVCCHCLRALPSAMRPHSKRPGLKLYCSSSCRKQAQVQYLLLENLTSTTELREYCQQQQDPVPIMLLRLACMALCKPHQPPPKPPSPGLLKSLSRSSRISREEAPPSSSGPARFTELTKIIKHTPRASLEDNRRPADGHPVGGDGTPTLSPRNSGGGSLFRVSGSLARGQYIQGDAIWDVMQLNSGPRLRESEIPPQWAHTYGLMICALAPALAKAPLALEDSGCIEEGSGGEAGGEMEEQKKFSWEAMHEQLLALTLTWYAEAAQKLYLNTVPVSSSTRFSVDYTPGPAAQVSTRGEPEEQGGLLAGALEPLSEHGHCQGPGCENDNEAAAVKDMGIPRLRELHAPPAKEPPSPRSTLSQPGSPRGQEPWVGGSEPWGRVQVVGHATYFIASFLAHDCDPNVEVVFPANNHLLGLRALRAIRPGEKLTRSFVDPRLEVHTRRDLLRCKCGISCHCVLCKEQLAEEEKGLPASVREFMLKQAPKV